MSTANTRRKRTLNYLVWFCKTKAELNNDGYNLVWINQLVEIVGSVDNIKFKEDRITQADRDSLNMYLFNDLNH